MKATRSNIGRSVEQPDPAIRFYLFYGPDQAQSRALGTRVVGALHASRFLIASSAVKSDPAVVADEAGAMNLFGGKRVIWIEPAGEDILEGIEALLEVNAAESPVIAIAGALRKTSGLLKLAESSAAALAYVSYIPEGRDAERMVIEVGRTLGLKISSPVAMRIADAAGGDQAIVTRELEKLALYVQASPESPKELTDEALNAVGANAEGDFLGLADLALAGDMNLLIADLAHLSRSGTEAIPIVRALQRRLLMLAPARARVECGESVGGVMTSFGKSLFWKDKTLVGRLLETWDAGRLATIAERAGRLERELMFSDTPPCETVGEELVAIARSARARR